MAHPRRIVEAVTRDFDWPDFDRWQSAFAAVGFFPPRWEGLEHKPRPHTPEAEAYRLRKSVLFQEWLDMLTHRSRIRAHYARQGIRARVERQDLRPPCLACDPFNGREVGPEPDAMPPFHPGCRCVLVAIHPGPFSRRSRL
jgi:hypothetical protein